MDKNIEKVFREKLDTDLLTIIISNSKNTEKASKVIIRPVIIKESLQYQVETHVGEKVFHENKDKDGIIEDLPQWFESLFKQVEIKRKEETTFILISKKGRANIKNKKTNVNKTLDINKDHDRKKQYILKEGKFIPFLFDLGVMNKDGQVKKARFNKFRQINRFLEYIEDILPSLDKDKTIKILDFGCGKSYLTFAMYYYLHEIKGYDLDVIGLDLKEDVIKTYNKLKDQYGYKNLEFIKGDIADYQAVEEVDMVVSLHACNEATDQALYKAVKWKAKVILAVPCCQHELNKTIGAEILGPIFKYGINKERIAALATDALRGNILEDQGYEVALLEFIDIAHTPKNILIRAVKKDDIRRNGKRETKECMEFLGVNHKLEELFRG